MDYSEKDGLAFYASDESASVIAKILANKPMPNSKHSRQRKSKVFLDTRPRKTSKVYKKHTSSKVHNPKSAGVSLVKERMAKYPGQYLDVNVKDKSLLFCNACNSVIQVKASVVKTHVTSQTHKDSVVARRKKEAENDSLKVVIENHFLPTEHGEKVVGATFSSEMKEFRIEVLETFLKSMTPLHRLKVFRGTLERCKLTVGDTQDLRSWVPLVQQLERQRVLDETKAQKII